MTTFCLAPTPDRGVASPVRLTLTGVLGGLALGGGGMVVVSVVSGAVDVLSDSFGQVSQSIANAIVYSIFAGVLGAIIGVVVGAAVGLISSAVGTLLARAGGRARIGVAAGAFVTAAALSYEPLTLFAPGLGAWLIALPVAAFTAWVMTVDRMPPRRRRR
ncbi:hypothetical protein [Frondihabitans cladoniiphilus]|uniref:Major facilitator superfamily (MFS) profile domain-containing protein n=1 Tax=Frondihabitans cladoniiphilus TaxID=715785 RepID=A0ABP8VLB9_9MICO